MKEIYLIYDNLENGEFRYANASNLVRSNVSLRGYFYYLTTKNKKDFEKYGIFFKKISPNEIFNTTGRTFIYPISTRSLKTYQKDEFNKSILDYINPISLDLIQNRRATLMIDFEEGFSSDELGFGYLEKLLTDKCIPLDKVYFLFSNLKSRGRYSFNTVILPFGWLKKAKKTEYLEYLSFNDVHENLENKKYNFLCYNQIIRSHRLLLLFFLFKNNLINDNLISFDKVSKEELEKYTGFSNNLLAKNKSLIDNIERKTPLILDQSDFSKNFVSVPDVIEHYNQSYFSIVTETLAQNDSIFFSEKIFKPILMYQPFFLLGCPGSLEKLKEYGFQTFNRWWDESYDLELNLTKRILKILKEVKRFSILREEQKKRIILEMKPVLEHNRKVYYSNSKLIIDEMAKMFLNL